MEMFGENFENYGKEENEPTTSSASKSTTVGKATKGKLQAKSTGHAYQFQIMESIGVPLSEIKRFADPHYWLDYFPPIAVVSLVGSDLLSGDQPFFAYSKIIRPWGHASIGVDRS
jgi:hypothetical protein